MANACVNDGALLPAEACNAEALVEALAHGDLRPSDVHVTADGAAQLTGFGRAAVADTEPTPSGDVQAFADLIRATVGGSLDLGGRLACRSATSSCWPRR